jgi:hypothetical protein
MGQTASDPCISIQHSKHQQVAAHTAQVRGKTQLKTQQKFGSKRFKLYSRLFYHAS